MKLYILIVLGFMYCSSFELSTQKEERDIYVCSMDPEVNELMQFAIQEKNLSKSNEILHNLISIRPNCFDLYQALSMNYALQNDLHNFQKYSNRGKFLYTEYNLLSGKSQSRNYTNVRNEKPRIIYGKPSRRKRLDYWRWKYIYCPKQTLYCE